MRLDSHRHRSFAQPHWYRIALDAAQVVAKEHDRIRDLFDRSYRARRQPKGMTLWIEFGRDRGATVFLSPSCVLKAPTLIHHTNAIRCAKPSGALRFFAGHQSEPIEKQAQPSGS